MTLLQRFEREETGSGMGHSLTLQEATENASDQMCGCGWLLQLSLVVVDV